MRWFVFIILGWACTVIQTTFFVPKLLALRPFEADVRPDLFILMALLVALVARPNEAFVVGWMIGMVEDLMGVIPSQRLGITALLLALVCYALCHARSVMIYERPITQIVLAAAMVLLMRPLQLLLASWLSLGPTIGLGLLVDQTLGDAVYTAILAWPFLWVMARLATHRGRLASRS
ncbi:MAG: rod shape-determining protein MreD [Planctomycetes bacterium]|nr:rod shape-determining protein MreD [Planctomycetota bacterium]